MDVFTICPGCGEYVEEKAVAITPQGAFARCPLCGHAHRFERLPLFVVSGASGTGKSTVGLALSAAERDYVVMDSDILWHPAFATPEDGYRNYRNLWLRVAKNIAQAGRPVVLVGSAMPEQFESCVERRYFSAIHYLALVCDDETLMGRLRARPAWRNSATDEVLATMRDFNRWLIEHAATTDPPMEVLDTSHVTVEETVDWVMAWLRRLWPPFAEANRAERA